MFSMNESDQLKGKPTTGTLYQSGGFPPHSTQQGNTPTIIRNGQPGSLTKEVPGASLKRAALKSATPLGRCREKSKEGCLTCKFRKKKCNEVKPVCHDCLKFKKECVWVDYNTMSKEEIKMLRLWVRQQESVRKMRKRRTKNDDQPPVAEATSKLAAPPKDKSDTEQQIGPSRQYIEALKAAYPMSSHPSSQVQPQLLIRQGTVLPPPFGGTPISLHDCANTDYHKTNQEDRHTGIVTRTEPLSSFTVPMALPGLRDEPDLPQMFGNNTKGHSPPPLDLEFYRDPADVNPGSPAAFLSFFKDLVQYNVDRTSPKVTMLDETAEKEVGDHIESVVLASMASPDIKLSPRFNIPDFLEQMLTLSHNSPEQLNHLASSFNAAFASSPQPPLSVLPGLDHSGNFLYNYYVDTLSRKVSIAPHSQNESNSYQKVFLPLAQKDKGVLYGILAWAGFHLGGSWLGEGAHYAELAVEHLLKDTDFNKASSAQEDRRSIINKLATILILCGAEICRGDVKYWSVYLSWGWKLLKNNGGILNFDNNNEEHWLISNFAYHDLLASSTSKRGTYFPMDTYLRIFADPGGVSKGNLNPLLGVCKSLFKVIGDINSLAYESKQSFDNYYGRSKAWKSGMAHPQGGPLQSPEAGSYAALDDINSDMSEHGRTSRLLLSIIERAKDLEQVIEMSRPDLDDLLDLSESELELQLTTFEAFQLSCKLYLRQSIMKCNPSSLESQVLVNDLVKCIDILVESPMQATLVFPIFIAGIHMVTEEDRANMNARIQKMMAMYGPWNVVRVKALMERVWEKNPDGDRVVDWHPILADLGWDINFA